MWLLLGDAAFPWNILVVVTVFIGFVVYFDDKK
jgi:hypothetical protein